MQNITKNDFLLIKEENNVGKKIIYDIILLKVSPTLSGSCKSDGIADKVISQCGYVENIATFIILRRKMKQERLNLYRIDMKYIRNLHNVDDRVSSVSPQIGKQHRIYVGIVVICNEKKYLIPLSHSVEKHKKMSARADFDKIIDKHGKLLGVLNYNLMIPVEEAQLIKLNLKESKTDSFKKLEIECERYNRKKEKL